MSAVQIDITYIYLLVALAVMVIPIGLLIGYKFIKRSVGDPAVQILDARKKQQSLILQLAPNNLWKIIPVIKKFGNTWFAADGPISITKDYLHPLVGAAPVIIENTLSSDPNDTFSFYANQLATQSGAKPPTLPEIVTFLDKREIALSDLIIAVNNIKSGNSLRSETEELMVKRNVRVEDEIAYQAIAQRLDDAVKSGTVQYMQELARVRDALKITKDDKTFDFVKNPVGDVIDVVSKETITIDDFVALTPAGTVQDVQTVAQRNEAVAVKEGQFTINSAMKYVAIGVVIFIGLVGLAYLVRS